MHNQNGKPNILCLGSENFIKSLNELTEYLDFNLIFYQDKSNDISSLEFSTMIIDSDVLKSSEIVKFINKLENKNKLLIYNSKNKNKHSFPERIEKPMRISELKKKIFNLINTEEFIQNSSIKIKKNYLLDKNEKKLKKDKLVIIVTEKEIELIELLFSKRSPIHKDKILEKVWGYASDADTHTVETHVYRLRKKIQNKFNDNHFIVSTKEGYSIWKKEIRLLSIYFLKNIEKELLEPKRAKEVLKEERNKIIV